MSVTSQYYSLGVGQAEQVVKLSLWDPAMRELPEEIVRGDEDMLSGVNETLRVRYQKEILFHGVVICFDSTDG